MMRCLFVILFVVCFGCEKKFDREIWLMNQHSDADNPRFDMTEDLRATLLQQGTKQSDVIALLGSPKSIDTILYANYKTHEFRYPIGSNPGFHMDAFYLIIDFDSLNQIAQTRVEGF